MTSNIDRINRVANVLVDKCITVYNKPKLKTEDSVLLVESGICTGIFVYYGARGNVTVNIEVEELRTEIRYPRHSHREIISEGRNTVYSLPLDKLENAGANAYHGRGWLNFDAPSSEFLAGSTTMYFRPRG